MSALLSLGAAILGPALLYLASTLVALWAARRGFGPIGRAAGVCLVLLPLCLTGPALVTGRVYAPVDMVAEQPPLAPDGGYDAHNRLATDIPFQIVPWHRAVRDAWSDGDPPLWNPSLLGGDVLAAAAQPAPYHPVNLAALLLPLDLALTYLASVFLFAAGLGAFLFARDLGCREASALVAAAGWALSSFVTFWLLWPMGLTVVGLPLVFLATRRVARFPGRQSLGLLTAAFVWILLAGHPESVLHIVAAGAVYGLFEVTMAARATEHAGRHVARAAGAALFAGVLALALCAIYLLPLVEALPHTTQYALRRSHFVHADHSIPLRHAFGRLRASLIPFVHGVPWARDGEAVIAPWFVPPSSAYVGSVLMAPILFGLWRHPWPGRWLLAALAAVGAMAGASFPGVTQLLGALPLFEMSIHKRWVCVAAFALAILAALGVEAWMHARERLAAGPVGDPTRRRLVLEMAALHVAVLIGLAGLLAHSWPGLLASGLTPDFLWPRAAMLYVPMVAAAALFVLGGRRTSVSVAKVAVGLVLVLVAQRMAEAGDRYPTLDRDAFYPPAAILSEIPITREPWRFAALDDLLPPNVAVFYDLEDVRGYEPMALRRLSETFRLWAEGDAYFNRVHDLDRPFLSFLGVRWALVPADLDPPSGWRREAIRDGFAVLENERVLPRAFVPAQVHWRPKVPRQWREMEATKDFGAMAWIEPFDDEEVETSGGAESGIQDNGAGRVTVQREGTGLALDVSMDRPGWLVTSQVAWPGWRVRDRTTGKSLPLARANHAFVAAHVEAGTHHLVMDYVPVSFRVGAWISAVTAIFLVVLAALGWRRRLGSVRHEVEVDG